MTIRVCSRKLHAQLIEKRFVILKDLLEKQNKTKKEGNFHCLLMPEPFYGNHQS